MPYIEQEQRNELDPLIIPLVERLIYYGDAGKVNYAITRIIDSVYGDDGYSDFNTGLGVLEAVKLEWYRKPIAKFEDAKYWERGDVYEQ